MITVKEYRGHIRNWEELCERLGIDLSLPREESAVRNDGIPDSKRSFH